MSGSQPPQPPQPQQWNNNPEGGELPPQQQLMPYPPQRRRNEDNVVTRAKDIVYRGTNRTSLATKFTSSAITLAIEEESRGRRCIVDREKWEMDVLAQLLRLDFHQFVFSPTRDRLVQGERENRANLSRSHLTETQQLDKLLLDLQEYQVAKENKIEAKKTKAERRSEELGRYVSEDLVSSDDDDEVTYSAFHTDTGLVVKRSMKSPLSSPTRKTPAQPRGAKTEAPARRFQNFAEQFDFRPLMFEERGAREQQQIRENVRWGEVVQMFRSSAVETEKREQRRKHLSRLAVWREARDQKIVAEEQTVQVFGLLLEVNEEESNNREVTVLEELGNRLGLSRRMHYSLHGVERFTMTVLSEGECRRIILEDAMTATSVYVAAMQGQEEVNRQCVAHQGMSPRHVEAMHQHAEKLRLLWKQWALKRDKVIQIQRFYKRLTFGFTGWRRTHKMIGETILKMRQQKGVNAEREVAKQKLVALRSQLERTQVDQREAEFQDMHKVDYEEDEARDAEIYEEVWQRKQLVRAFKWEAAFSIVSLQLRKVENVAEVHSRRKIQREGEDLWTNLFVQFFQEYRQTIRDKERWIQQEGVERRKAQNQEKVQFSAIAFDAQRRHLCLSEAPFRAALKLEEPLRFVITVAEPSSRHQIDIEWRRIVEAKYREFQRQRLEIEFHDSLDAQNLWTTYIQYQVKELDSFVTMWKEEQSQEILQQEGANVMSNFMVVFEVVEDQVGRQPILHDEKQNWKIISEHIAWSWSQCVVQWNTHLEAGAKIASFYHKYSEGQVGRTGMRKYLSERFQEKREIAELKRIRAEQKKEVAASRSELDDALFEHTSETKKDFFYRFVSLEKVEARSRSDKFTEEMFLRNIFCSNFMMWLQGLIKEELKNLNENEGYWRIKLQDEWKASFHENFPGQAATLVKQNAAIPPAQRAWRCHRARKELMSRRDALIAAWPTKEFEERSIIEQQEIMSMCMGQSELSEAEYLRDSFHYNLSQIPEFYYGCLTCVLQEALASRGVVLGRQEVDIRRRTVEKVEAEAFLAIKKIFERESEADLQLTILESTDRRAIYNELLRTLVFKTIQDVEESARMAQFTPEVYHRSLLPEMESLGRVHLLDEEWYTGIAPLVNQGEETARMIVEEDYAEEAAQLDVVCKEARFRRRVQFDLYSDFLEGWRGLLERQDMLFRESSSEETNEVLANYYLSKVVVAQHAETLAREEMEARAQAVVTLVSNEESATREEAELEHSHESAIHGHCMTQWNSAVKRALESSQAEDEERVLLLSLQEKDQRHAVVEHQEKYERSSQETHHKQIQLGGQEHAERLSVIIEQGQWFDQMLAVEERLARDVAAAAIQRQWRSKMLQDQLDSERGKILLEAVFLMEDTFNAEAAAAASMFYSENQRFLEVESVEATSRAEIAGLVELSLWCAQALDKLTPQATMEPEADARVDLTVSNFFDPLVTARTRKVMEEVPRAPRKNQSNNTSSSKVVAASSAKSPTLLPVDPSGKDRSEGGGSTTSGGSFTLDESEAQFDVEDDSPVTQLRECEQTFYLLHSPVFAEQATAAFRVAREMMYTEKEVDTNDVSQLEDAARTLLVTEFTNGGGLRQLCDDEAGGRGPILEEAMFRLHALVHIIPQSEARREEMDTDEDLNRLEMEEHEETSFKIISQQHSRMMIKERQLSETKKAEATGTIQRVYRGRDSALGTALSVERFELEKQEGSIRADRYTYEEYQRAQVEAQYDSNSAAIAEQSKARAEKVQALEKSQAKARCLQLTKECVSWEELIRLHLEIDYEVSHEKISKMLTPIQAATKLTSWGKMVMQQREYRLAQRINHKQREVRLKQESEDLTEDFVGTSTPPTTEDDGTPTPPTMEDDEEEEVEDADTTVEK